MRGAEEGDPPGGGGGGAHRKEAVVEELGQVVREEDGQGVEEGGTKG